MPSPGGPLIERAPNSWRIGKVCLFLGRSFLLLLLACDWASQVCHCHSIRFALASVDGFDGMFSGLPSPAGAAGFLMNGSGVAAQALVIPRSMFSLETREANSAISDHLQRQGGPFNNRRTTVSTSTIQQIKAGTEDSGNHCAFRPSRSRIPFLVGLGP